jgi:hypothetical protein
MFSQVEVPGTLPVRREAAPQENLRTDFITTPAYPHAAMQYQL